MPVLGGGARLAGHAGPGDSWQRQRRRTSTARPRSTFSASWTRRATPTSASTPTAGSPSGTSPRPPLFGWDRDEAVGRMLQDLIIPPEMAHAHTDRVRPLPGRPASPRSSAGSSRCRPGTVPVRRSLSRSPSGRSPTTGHAASTRSSATSPSARPRTTKLRQTNEDLQAFAAMAAHDLRSPLAVISMYAELVIEELEDGSFDPATAGERLHRIRRAADRGVALVEDLLAYASIGSESLDIGSVDLTMLAQAVAAEHQASADRRVHVKVEMLPEVEGSLPLLRQLLSNLIGNAVKYTPADREVQIRVDTVAGPLRRLGDHPDHRQRRPDPRRGPRAAVRHVPARRPPRRARVGRRAGDLPAGRRGARRPGAARPGLLRRQPLLHRARGR